MSWGWVYVIIAAVFVAMLIGYAVWLWHKATDVYAEVKVLGRRAGQLADVLARLDLAPLDRGPAGRRDADLIGEDYPAAARRETDTEPWLRVDDPDDDADAWGISEEWGAPRGRRD